MKLGACVPNYGETSSPEAVRTVASHAERIGYDSVWCTDHVLMSKDSGTPYEKILDSITTLAYLSATTSKVRLGISSLIVPMRNPVIVAKQLATIDNLAAGRVMLAVGAGWNETEFSNLGSNFHNRGKRLDSSIRLIRSIWSGKSNFESKLLSVKIRDGVFQPPPMKQQLTIWVGGSSPAAMKRALELGDAWHPNVQPFDKFKGLVSEFRQISPDAESKEICVRIGVNLRADKSEYLSPLGEKRLMLSSNRSENRGIVQELEALGVHYAVIVPSPNGKISVPDQVNGLEIIARDFL
jgi:probable F420-dependent oxidoreductase